MSVVPVLVTAVWEVAEVEPVVAVSVPVMLEPVVVCVSVKVVFDAVVVLVLVTDVIVKVELICVDVDVMVKVDVMVTVSDKVVVTVLVVVTVSLKVVVTVTNVVTVSVEAVITVADAVTVSDEVMATVMDEADVVLVPDVAAVTAPVVDEAVTVVLLMGVDAAVAIGGVVVSAAITAGSARISFPEAPAAQRGPLPGDFEAGPPRISIVLYAICAW